MIPSGQWYLNWALLERAYENVCFFIFGLNVFQLKCVLQLLCLIFICRSKCHRSYVFKRTVTSLMNIHPLKLRLSCWLIYIDFRYAHWFVHLSCVYVYGSNDFIELNSNFLAPKKRMLLFLVFETVINKNPFWTILKRVTFQKYSMLFQFVQVLVV